MSNLGRQFNPPVPETVSSVQSGGMGHIEGDESRSVVGMVPVHLLRNFRTLDRTGKHAYSGSKDTINSIEADIRSGKGITNPLQIAYDHKNKWGILAEGHHRLEAAMRAGISHVPVTIYRQPGLDDEKEQGKGSHLAAITDFRNKTQKELGQEYVPTNIHPAHFKQFMG